MTSLKSILRPPAMNHACAVRRLPPPLPVLDLVALGQLLQVQLVHRREVAHSHLVWPDEPAVAGRALKQPLAAHRAVVLAQRLVIRHAHPPAQGQALHVAAHKPAHAAEARVRMLSSSATPDEMPLGDSAIRAGPGPDHSLDLSSPIPGRHAAAAAHRAGLRLDRERVRVRGGRLLHTQGGGSTCNVVWVPQVMPPVCLGLRTPAQTDRGWRRLSPARGHLLLQRPRRVLGQLALLPLPAHQHTSRQCCTAGQAPPLRTLLPPRHLLCHAAHL